jgi:uncharacterized protein with NRDE domain
VCTLLALRARDGLWIAANRDEKLDRPWQPPQLLVPSPPVLGGRDLVGGGSWLAVNLDSGFVVAVTNARLGARPGNRSRGQLVVELATEPSLVEAIALFTELDLTSYGPANLLLADRERTILATNTPQPWLQERSDGVVALRNEPLDAPGQSTGWAASLGSELIRREPVTAETLATLLARHDGPDPLCRHGNGYGTVCASILRLGRSSKLELSFAPGPPCTTELAAVDLSSSRGSDPDTPTISP